MTMEADPASETMCSFLGILNAGHLAKPKNKRL